MTDPAAARDALVRGLEAEQGAKDGTRGWTSRYFGLATLDSLQARTASDLTAIARRHLAMILRRKPGEVLIEVQPPRDPSATGSDALATIDTCADDMPFIVDTVTMAVREAGVPIDWTVHPVLRLKRDAEGRLLGLDDHAPAESLIHFEIEPLADAAAYRRLHESLVARFADLRIAVQDFAAMSGRARALVAEMLQARGPGSAEDASESREFLQWLDNDRFTYLAVAETQVEAGPDGKPRFVPLPNAGLGLARPGARFSDTDALIAPPDELAKYAESPRTVVLTKALQRSPIHHDEFMDVVSVKHYRADGTVAGTTRFLGLFSGEAYLEPPAAIPIVRRKAAMVLQRSGYDPEQHSGKMLLEILHGLPRDELFQSGEDELFQTCMGIMALRDRHQLRLFLRRDRYGRFFSALVYLPRDRYSRELRDRVAQELLAAVQGQSIDRTVEFLRGGRTRIHYLVRTAPGTVLKQSAADIERQLVAVTRPWRDQLREALSSVAGASTASLATRFADAFTGAYTERTSPSAAAADTLALARLSDQVRVLPRLQANGKTGTRLKLYTWRQSLSLSDVLPTLENFGLRVIRQDPEPVTPRGGTGDDGTLWVQDFEVELPASEAANAKVFEEALLAVLDGRAEDDGLNRMVLAAGLDGRQVVGLRTLAKYLNQIGLPYGRTDIERIISENATVAKLVVEQFEARFDPAHDASRRPTLEVGAAQALDDALDKVASLDADRILRVLVSVVRAGLRTNFYQKDANGEPKPYVSLKLDPRKVLELPLPLPMYEIWVYAPEVEGIHLRGGRVARGGLRWSDRREDFRTEVLGLMKAQNVKNAVIVPVGAKGGFVVKRGPPPSERDAWMANGIACYKTFLRGLLDITDNRVGDGVVPPEQVVRHDDDDPYLVVAADKGTATFSDIANGLAADYGFWLGDAFASGGSAGYDHKKMGITARGAWESVSRHFREVGRDIQSEAFT
ncbi:MAG TPA: NAD-glutamate dehydrogenase domain-containing protein [Nevskiaceae bacterium]|nr:NAD-glutamate dehydrogenase domain-containing protein [Nevskiaceae bacterium]